MRAFLGMGSNLGDRWAYLRDAVDSLSDVVAVSSVYGPAPVGGPVDQDAYLNIVVELDTELTARQLMSVGQRLQAAAERVQSERWGPRTLDVDVLWIDGVGVEEPDLQVPHPRMFERRFVLAPLAELAPELVSEQALADSVGSVAVVGPLR